MSNKYLTTIYVKNKDIYIHNAFLNLQKKKNTVQQFGNKEKNDTYAVSYL